MFGKPKELLPKDVLVDLESNPKRADEMIEKIAKGQGQTEGALAWETPMFVTATASAAPLDRSGLERALRQMGIATSRLSSSRRI